MSEYLNNNIEKLDKLIQFSRGILRGNRGADLYKEYKDVVETVTPNDVVVVVDDLVNTGEDMLDVKRAVNKILNVFYKPVKKYGKVHAEKDSFLYHLMAENAGMESRLKSMKKLTKAVFQERDKVKALQKQKDSLLDTLVELKDYDKHYLKKENILFPYFEKHHPDHLCVNVMWSMHDDARRSLNKLIDNLKRDRPSINEFNQEIGKLYFAVLPVIFREEYILFPICEKIIEAEMWDEMAQQSSEIGYAFITPPEEQVKNSDPERDSKPVFERLIDLETGKLDVEQIKDLFNHLPVDITYVDENDEVRYFSNPKKRHFTRSKAIIGRQVQNCHPPESIDVVNKIVDSFRSGMKDSESFWIKMNGRFILIQYFAVRDKQGNYKGVAEVSQDITDIKKLEGEKKLLD